MRFGCAFSDSSLLFMFIKVNGWGKFKNYIKNKHLFKSADRKAAAQVTMHFLVENYNSYYRQLCCPWVELQQTHPSLLKEEFKVVAFLVPTRQCYVHDVTRFHRYVSLKVMSIK